LQRKWELWNDPYFKRREGTLTWRHYEGLVKPLMRKTPLVGERHFWLELGRTLFLPLLTWWSAYLVAEHERETRR
jgi:hypothetical protein